MIVSFGLNESLRLNFFFSKMTDWEFYPMVEQMHFPPYTTARGFAPNDMMRFE